MMAEITTLGVAETIRVDGRRLGDIVNEMGVTAARDLITRALEQLALTLRAVDLAIASGDLSAGADHADRLARLAWQIGLLSLAGVAMDLGGCAERRDLASLAAVRARLMRVGNRSLTEIWDQAGMS